MKFLRFSGIPKTLAIAYETLISRSRGTPAIRQVSPSSIFTFYENDNRRKGQNCPTYKHFFFSNRQNDSKILYQGQHTPKVDFESTLYMRIFIKFEF